MTFKTIPAVEDLKSRLSYDPETGIFRWKWREGARSQWNGRFPGKVAGAPNRLGYVEIRIDDVAYYAHRLAWVYVFGRLDDATRIDHRDGNPGNNAIANLRVATQSQNMANRKANRGRELPKGVYLMPSGKYRVEIGYNGGVVRLGHHRSLAAARAAYAAAAVALYGEFANV